MVDEGQLDYLGEQISSIASFVGSTDRRLVKSHSYQIEALIKLDGFNRNITWSRLYTVLGAVAALGAGAGYLRSLSEQDPLGFAVASLASVGALQFAKRARKRSTQGEIDKSLFHALTSAALQESLSANKDK